MWNIPILEAIAAKVCANVVSLTSTTNVTGAFKRQVSAKLKNIIKGKSATIKAQSAYTDFKLNLILYLVPVLVHYLIPWTQKVNSLRDFSLSINDRVHCFSIQIVMNKGFHLNPEKNLAQIRLVVFKKNAPLILKNDVTEPKVRLS